MKGLLLGAALTALATGHATAAEFIETFTGTFTNGTASAGVFGPNAIDLTGMSFALAFDYDTDLASFAEGPPYSTLVFDGTNGAYLSGLTLTVDGQTIAAPDTDILAEFFDYADSTGEPHVSAVALIPNGSSVTVTVVGSGDVTYDQPFVYPGSPFYSPLDFHADDGTPLVEANLAADCVTLVAAGDAPTMCSAPPTVPEPASWALMLAGFGLVGASLRGRPARSPYKAS